MRFCTSRCLLLASIIGTMGGLACGPTPPGANDGNVGINPGDFPHLHIEGEPNDTFTESVNVIFDADGIAQLAGTISTASDVDVYDLGPVAPGDRIRVDVGTHGNRLDAAAAIFDEGGRIMFENDDRNLELNQFDPFINEPIRRETAFAFLAITSSPLAASTGDYDVHVTITRGGTPPETPLQTVALDFDGGTVVIPDDDTYTVGPFDTAEIDPAYAGMTTAVMDQIVATVEENYTGLGLEILVVPGDTLPAGCTFSRVLFGGRNPSAFGISKAVDPYNADPCDEAIIFTEMFTPARFGRVLTAAELGTAIGNIAAHELGHLLGLNHVQDIDDLMDNTGTATTFLRDQVFKNSVLSDDIFPIGTQDGFLLLLETIGMAP